MRTTWPSTCPSCHSDGVDTYQYGLMPHDFDKPGVVLGGCVIMPESPDLRCRDCGHAWKFGGAAGCVATYAGQLFGLVDGPGISSPLGLWLLLALLAPELDEDAQRFLASRLGTNVSDARVQASRLLAEPHPAVASAIGAWAADPRVAGLLQRAVADLPGVGVGPVPPQQELDAWASGRTHGLVRRFPVAVRPETVLLFASALVGKTSWTHEMDEDDDGRLVTGSGRFLVCDTQAAGRVAVAVPADQDGLSVMSVIAAPDVPQADVVQATYEIAKYIRNDWLGEYEVPAAELEDGHAWTVRERLDDGWEPRVEWTCVLPAWTLESEWDLTAAPGVDLVRDHVVRLAPDLPPPVTIECRQAATGEYSSTGFIGTAVTAMGLMCGSAMPHDEVLVREVEVVFDRPHAVLAVARGGAWDGVPVFQAWVDPLPGR